MRTCSEVVTRIVYKVVIYVRTRKYLRNQFRGVYTDFVKGIYYFLEGYILILKGYKRYYVLLVWSICTDIWKFTLYTRSDAFMLGNHNSN
jgi:hypothetical protein